MMMNSKRKSQKAFEAFIKAIRRSILAVSILGAAFNTLVINAKMANEEMMAFDRAINEKRRKQKQRLIKADFN